MFEYQYAVIGNYACYDPGLIQYSIYIISDHFRFVFSRILPVFVFRPLEIYSMYIIIIVIVYELVYIHVAWWCSTALIHDIVELVPYCLLKSIPF